MVLTFDYKGWGDSEGSRSRLAPYSRVADVQAALTFIGTLPEVDPARLGIYGTSYGGATVVWTGAVDTRVKCVVSVVGIGDGTRWMRSVRRPDEFHDLLDRSAQDRVKRTLEGKSEFVKREEILLPDRQSAELAAAARRNNPAAVGTIPLECVAETLEFSPEWVVDRIAPRPCSSSPPTTIASCRRRNPASSTRGRASRRSWWCSRATATTKSIWAGVQRGHAGDAGLVPAILAGPPRLEENVMPSPLSGKAQTVLGAVDADAMGITLPHEHLLIDFEVMFKEPAAASDKGLAYEPVSLPNVGWVRQNFNANLDNLRLLDEQAAQDEIMLFRRAGGQTVVDPTNASLSRDPLALARIARATELNIVMGAGYYVAAAHPADMDRRSEDGHRARDRRRGHEGVGDTGVRAGFIGEIGTTWPWTDNEKKVVRAAVDRPAPDRRAADDPPGPRSRALPHADRSS